MIGREQHHLMLLGKGHTSRSVSSDQPAPYLQVIDCWAVAEQLDKLLAAIARAEIALPTSPDFFAHVELMLLRNISATLSKRPLV